MGGREIVGKGRKCRDIFILYTVGETGNGENDKKEVGQEIKRSKGLLIGKGLERLNWARVPHVLWATSPGCICKFV